ncbi:hypothetical protein [Halomonas organivorans]|uniref:Uncharacterized protein n=1 Tax=Halomonas organivorans TaxID=257772 RepID=A0A7W5G4P9_9GAMM|nr:hypothetical protein [Halomonas organivorans]MBB3140210.1 hypothetical protein [Halomonas organivorans]
MRRDLLNRLEAVEIQGCGDDASVRHIFLVPGSRDPERQLVAGYRTAGTATYRHEGESSEACLKRHIAGLDISRGRDVVKLLGVYPVEGG